MPLSQQLVERLRKFHNFYKQRLVDKKYQESEWFHLYTDLFNDLKNQLKNESDIITSYTNCFFLSGNDNMTDMNTCLTNISHTTISQNAENLIIEYLNVILLTGAMILSPCGYRNRLYCYNKSFELN